MAFTKIVGAGIHTLSNVHTHNVNSSGIITATSFVGPFNGSNGDFSGNVTIDGNLTVNGTTTTLDTNLTEVDKVEVAANNSTVGVAITQSGSGDIVNLFDGTTEVLTVKDGGFVGVGTINPQEKLHITDSGNPKILIEDTDGSNQVGVRYKTPTQDWTAGLHGGATSFKISKSSAFGTNDYITINGSGKVGINSSSPREKLEVLGNANIIVDNNKGIKLGYRGENKTAYIGLDANDNANAGTQSWANSAYIGFYSDGSTERSITYRTNVGSHIFQGTNGDEYARIMSTGAIGINTTTGTNTVNIGGAAGLGLKFHNFTSGNSSYITVESGDKLQSNVGGSGYYTWVTGGSEKVRIASNGRVGIGTDNPNAQLDVYKSGTATVVDTIITRTSGGGAFAVQCSDVAAANPVWALRTYSNEDIVFSPGGHANANEKVRIKADTGNVGIGTDDPDEKLHVYNGAGDVTSFVEAIAGDALLNLSNSGNGNYSGINFIRERGSGQTGRNGGCIFMPSNTANNEAFLYIQAQSTSAQAGVTGALSANNGVRLKLHGDDGIFSIETGADERLRIDSAGNVGISTNDPQTLLHLKSSDPTLRIQRYNQSAYGDITADTAGKITFKSDPGGAASGDGFSFTVNNSEKVRITSAGLVGIGTQTPESLPLTVAASTAAIALVDTDRTNSNYYSAVWGDQVGNLHLVADYEGAAGSQFISARVGGTALSNEKLRITSTGLDVTGSITADDLRTDNSQTFYLTTANDFRFRHTGGSEKLRIDSSGRLLTGGATSSQGSTNSDDLQIGANNQGNQTGITLGSASGSSIRFADAGSDTAGAMAYYHSDDSMRFTAGASERLRITSGGIQVGGSYQFTTNPSTDTVLPNTHYIGDVSSNSISYYHTPGLYYVYLTCPTDNNWYTMMTSINDSASNFRGVCGDASSKNSFYWYFNPTSPSYGVNPYGEKWHHGAWNTGSVTFRLDGTHPNWNLQIKCTSHYGTNRTAALRAVMEVYY